MNMSQITVFRAVMTSASLSEAARKLGRTQPAVSLAIKALEEDLGMNLFERQSRQLVPVPEAHYLLAETEDILSRVSTVSRTMRSFADGSAGALKVSTFPGVSGYLFPQFIAEFVADMKDVEVTLTSRSSEQIAEFVRSQSIDFGFCDAPALADAHQSQITSEVISGDCFVAMSKTHPLAKKRKIDLPDLAGQSFAALQAGHTHQHNIAEVFGEAGVANDVAIESQTFTPLLQFVMLSRRVAIVDPLTIINERQLPTTNKAVVFRRLDFNLRYRYAVLSPRHRPVSQLASRTMIAWKEKISNLLTEVGARPAWE